MQKQFFKVAYIDGQTFTNESLNVLAESVYDAYTVARMQLNLHATPFTALTVLVDGYPVDEFNPRFLFSMTATELLVKIANGEIDAIQYAKQTLDNRGQSHLTGEWIGFTKK